MNWSSLPKRVSNLLQKKFYKIGTRSSPLKKVCNLRPVFLVVNDPSMNEL
jgi:hypothetical protein